MAQLSTILDRVHDEFPSVPEPLALRALADSAKEFCTRSHIWQGTLPAIRTRAGKTEFELSPDIGSMVVALKEVRFAADGERIPPYPTELKRLLVTPLPAAAKPLGYIQRRPAVIELVNATGDPQQLTVLAALTLVQGYTSFDLPDDLLDEYAEALGAGAKFRLVRQAGQPWYAPDAALPYAAGFYSGVNAAKTRTMTALGAADLRVEMRSW